jgi:hypothetical protein
VRENGRNLERPNNAPPRGLRRLFMRDVNTVEHDAALGGRQEFGQQVKKRRFPRPIGPNQRMNVAALDLQVNLIDGDKPFEFLGQTARLENGINWQMALQKT